MGRLRYAWAMGVLSVVGLVATAGWAGVSTTGDTKDDGSVFYAGYNSDTTGGLTIDAGSVFNRGDGYLGYSSGSMGTAVVTGAGSTWTNSGVLYVGRDGSGALTVSDGGIVSANTLYASLSDLQGDGTITVQSGGVLDADLVFDAAQGIRQTTVGFGTGGTLQFTAAGNVLGVGYKHSGSLRIGEARSIRSARGYLGFESGSTGDAVVTGVGSRWTNSGDLYVGYKGRGTLRVEAGAQVVTEGSGSEKTRLGYNSGSTGEATISGTGSTWSTFNLSVGYSGNGTLKVESGGQVSDSTGYLGYDSGATGTATVTGAGSTWTTSGEFFLGYSGSGTLWVLAGGRVSSGNEYSYADYSTYLLTVAQRMSPGFPCL